MLFYESTKAGVLDDILSDSLVEEIEAAYQEGVIEAFTRLRYSGSNYG